VRIEHDRQPIHVIIGTTRMSPPSSGSICIYFASRHAPIGFGGSRWMAQPVQQMGRTDPLKPATPFIQTHRPTSSPPLSLRVFHRWAFTRSGIHYLAQPQCHPVTTSIFRLPVSRSPSLPMCRLGGSVSARPAFLFSGGVYASEHRARILTIHVLLLGAIPCSGFRRTRLPDANNVFASR
jgi:hypothetical protein